MSPGSQQETGAFLSRSDKRLQRAPRASEDDPEGGRGLRAAAGEESAAGTEYTLWTTTSTSCPTEPAWPRPSMASRRERQRLADGPEPPERHGAPGAAT
ncbi:hypothetical protein EYF80_024836 [Liparis tanakae]|uniref:Uncharacterized protein n=1 Tax=Liparis tanakae TaxID=230148 RepID=A0A4Z2HJB4_9TELE|nr:hypothetical protein EYF80_024836 [Liparis tanakae]